MSTALPRCSTVVYWAERGILSNSMPCLQLAIVTEMQEKRTRARPRTAWSTSSSKYSELKKRIVQAILQSNSDERPVFIYECPKFMVPPSPNFCRVNQLTFTSYRHTCLHCFVLVEEMSNKKDLQCKVFSKNNSFIGNVILLRKMWEGRSLKTSQIFVICAAINFFFFFFFFQKMSNLTRAESEALSPTQLNRLRS
ncbi:hypothetical protein ABW19_dt0201151 [Dactylella cylindrospora]|nr:hypothetical protein ABW19_dt0201151 [Dactylella cylindrospora]